MSLTYQQRSALEESLRHWERMLKPENWQGIERPTGSQCACCIAFDGCEECPIFEHTEVEDCEGTPYYKARSAWDNEEQTVFQDYGGAMVDLMKEILKEKKHDNRRIKRYL